MPGKIMSRGRPLPENVVPSGLRCLVVYIPDDDIYLQAFADAYQSLGTWLEWEKDGTNRAAIAAMVWKDAIDYTYQNGWVGGCGDIMNCDCEDITNRLQVLESAIQEIMNMNINVNCGCGCGGYSQNELGQVLTPANTSGLSQSAVTVDCSEVGQPDDTRCTYANLIVDSWLSFLGDVAGQIGAGSFSIDALMSLIAGLFWGTGFISAAYALAAAIVQWATGDALVLAINWVQTNRSMLITAIYSAASPAEAQNAVNDVITASSLNAGSKAILWAIVALTDWNSALGETMQVPAGYVGSTVCSFGSPPEVPEGYYLKDGVITNIGGDYNVAAVNQSYSGNEAFFEMDQDQDGAFLDATSYVDLDFSSIADCVGWLVLVDQYVAMNDSDLIIGDNNNPLLSTQASLTGLNGSWQCRGRLASEAGLEQFVTAVPAGFYDEMWDGGPNRFGIRNVDQSIDAQMSCRLRIYAITTSP